MAYLAHTIPHNLPRLWERGVQLLPFTFDANLTLLIPVVGESGHGVDTSEAHRSFLVPELVGGCRITLSKLIGVGSMRVSLDESLLAVAIDANKDGTDEPGNGDRSLDDVKRIDRR